MSAFSRSCPLSQGPLCHFVDSRVPRFPFLSRMDPFLNALLVCWTRLLGPPNGFEPQRDEQVGCLKLKEVTPPNNLVALLDHHV
jgi:hypothetical protein